MRKAFYCLAAGAIGLVAAGYLADTARSDVRVTAFNTVSVDRSSKGDRLPAFAVKAIRESAGTDENARLNESPLNITVVARRGADKSIEKRSIPGAEDGSRDDDRDARGRMGAKKLNKMMDGCEASVSPLSPASAQARASRCVA